MQFYDENQRGRAIILAGGEGKRLSWLTQRIAGDARPKQFCSVLGDSSVHISEVAAIVDSGRVLDREKRRHLAHRPEISRATSSVVPCGGSGTLWSEKPGWRLCGQRDWRIKNPKS
jgi:hypothetical protein